MIHVEFINPAYASALKFASFPVPCDIHTVNKGVSRIQHPRGEDPEFDLCQSGRGPGDALDPLVGSRGRVPVGVQGAKPPENVRF